MASASSSSRTLWIVFLTVFLDLVGFGIIIPIQPFYAELLGASPAVVTLLGASFSLMQFLFAPFWGRLSDKVGRRPIMLASIATSTAGYALFGFSSSLAILFVARMLAGFGSANIGTAQAIIADSTTPEKRAKGMGIIGAAFGLGFIFGPALGGFFVQFGLPVPAFVAAGLCFINFGLAFWLLPETRPLGSTTGARHRVFSFKALRSAAQNRNVGQLLFLFLFFTTGFSLMEQVIGLFVGHYWAQGSGEAYAREAARLTTYMLLLVGVTSTIVQGGLIGRLVKRFGEKQLLILGLTLVGIAFALIPIAGSAGSYPWFLASAILIAAGTGITNPSIMSLLSRSVGATDQGGVLGIGQSLSALGRVLGPTVAGTLFQLSPGTPFWVGAGLMVVCATIGFTIRPAIPTATAAQ